MENKFQNAINEIAKILGVQMSADVQPVVEDQVELAAPVEDTTQPAQAETETPEQETAEDNTVIDLQNRVAVLEQALTQLMTDMQMSKDTAVKLSKVVETIASMPAGEPIKRTESMSSEQPKDNSALKLFSGQEKQKMESIFRAIKK